MLSRMGYEKRSVTTGPISSLGLPYGNITSPISLQLAMQLSTVYRCVEVISDAVASQTWQVLKHNNKEGFVHEPFHYADYLLNVEPNKQMSRFIMMKTATAKMLLEGEAFLHIERNGMGNPVELKLITDTVKPYKRDNGSMYYEVGEPGKEVKIEDEDAIRILNFSYDGIIGVSTLRHAANTMGLAYSSEKTAKGFFSSGANMSGIIAAEGKLTPEKAKAIKDSWADAFNISSGQPGGIAVMEGGLAFKPVTVNPKDAQMLETRQFNVIEICRFFGVHPSKVFDQSNLTYSNIESFQLGFLTDTMTSLDAKIEGEFNRKLLRPSERPKTRLSLNIEELLRANLDAKANYVSKMFQAGGYTVNEVRKRAGNPKHDHENADKPMVQINMQTIDNFAKKEDTKFKENGEPERKQKRDTQPAG